MQCKLKVNQSLDEKLKLRFNSLLRPYVCASRYCCLTLAPSGKFERNQYHPNSRPQTPTARLKSVHILRRSVLDVNYLH